MEPDGLKDTRRVPVAGLGERLSAFRLRGQDTLEAMRHSLLRHGQLTAIELFTQGEQLEVLDGFKRVQAARTLGWSDLVARTREVDLVEAKVQLTALHNQQGLTELEEAWVVRSLHRDDGLSQTEIARRLWRHKSWVCRRLLLVEALAPEVGAEVRLGLLGPRAAIALTALPRGNQRAASAVAIRHGLTVRQTEALVRKVLELKGDTAQASWLAHRLEAGPEPPTKSTSRRPLRSEADGLACDVAALLRMAARLQARLSAPPIGALFTEAAGPVFDGLVTLAPVLTQLAKTVSFVTGRESKP